MMTVHNADSLEKQFKCFVCDKAFSIKEYLTLHIKYVFLFMKIGLKTNETVLLNYFCII